MKRGRETSLSDRRRICASGKVFLNFCLINFCRVNVVFHCRYPRATRRKHKLFTRANDFPTIKPLIYHMLYFHFSSHSRLIPALCVQSRTCAPFACAPSLRGISLISIRHGVARWGGHGIAYTTLRGRYIDTNAGGYT